LAYRVFRNEVRLPPIAAFVREATCTHALLLSNTVAHKSGQVGIN
jgi:hypothetical protein